jgi:hypothetical protein
MSANLRFMIDPIMSRALLAIVESHAIRQQRRMLRAQHERAVDDLRYTVLESASIRAEIKACRDDRENDENRN